MTFTGKGVIMAHKSRATTTHNLILDICLTAGFAATLNPFFTGIALHEWLGLAVGLGIAVHTLRHRRWIRAISARLRGTLPLETRLCYVLDALLLLGFTALIATGLRISQAVLPAAGLEGDAALLLARVHSLAAWVSLAGVALKLALHARWLGSALRGLWRMPGGTRASATRGEGPHYSRRRFLKACGLGLGATIALSLWRQARIAPAPMPALDSAAPPVAAAPEEALAKPPTPAVAAKPSEAASGAPDAAPTLDPTVQPAPTTEPTIAPVPSPTALPRVRCPYGLVNDPYPGRCRRYTDQNGNGMCDLSETT